MTLATGLRLAAATISLAAPLATTVGRIATHGGRTVLAALGLDLLPTGILLGAENRSQRLLVRLTLLTHGLLMGLTLFGLLTVEYPYLLSLLGTQTQSLGHSGRLMLGNLLHTGLTAPLSLTAVLSHGLGSGHQQNGCEPNHSTTFHTLKN